MEQRADKVREQHIVRGVLIVDKPDHGGYQNNGSHNDTNCFFTLDLHFSPLLSVNMVSTKEYPFEKFLFFFTCACNRTQIRTIIIA